LQKVTVVFSPSVARGNYLIFFKERSIKMKGTVKIITVLAILVLCSRSLAMDGSGTETDPYIITNVDELQAMRDDLSAYYQLGNDIDACDTRNWNGGAGFEPVGNGTTAFTGSLDGRMHTITGLYINRGAGEYIGLVGVALNGAEISNVGLADADITGFKKVGALVGCNDNSTVSCCWSSGIVRGLQSGAINSRVGGLAGVNVHNSLMVKCYSTANVTSGACQVGGLSGYNGHGSIVIDCYAMGDVTGSYKVGGLVGDNCYPEGGYVMSCYSTGKVTGMGGGLIGFNYLHGVTYDSYWDIETSGKATSYGGTGKTTEEMMQQATFANWDFNDVWGIYEGETYPFLLWEMVEIAIAHLEDAIAKKAAALELLADALELEADAYEALVVALDREDYGDLTKSDILKAKQEIHSAIQVEEQAVQSVEKGAGNLEESLETLTGEGEEP
jgi:hypothetical protein